MAVTRVGTTTKLGFKVITGTDENGNPVNAVRSFSGVNPDASDEALLAVGKALGSLQSHTVNAYVRTDVSNLMEG